MLRDSVGAWDGTPSSSAVASRSSCGGMLDLVGATEEGATLPSDGNFHNARYFYLLDNHSYQFYSRMQPAPLENINLNQSIQTRLTTASIGLR